MFQLEYACLHQTVNIVPFTWKKYDNIYPKGRSLMQMYRVFSSNEKKKLPFDNVRQDWHVTNPYNYMQVAHLYKGKVALLK